MDGTAQKGGLQLAKAPLDTDAQRTGLLGEITFTLNGYTEDVEIRVWVSANSDLQVTGIQIEQTPDETGAEPTKEVPTEDVVSAVAEREDTLQEIPSPAIETAEMWSHAAARPLPVEQTPEQQGAEQPILETMILPSIDMADAMENRQIDAEHLEVPRKVEGIGMQGVNAQPDLNLFWLGVVKVLGGRKRNTLPLQTPSIPVERENDGQSAIETDANISAPQSKQPTYEFGHIESITQSDQIFDASLPERLLMPVPEVEESSPPVPPQSISKTLAAIARKKTRPVSGAKEGDSKLRQA
jgi:hypothetical protein